MTSSALQSPGRYTNARIMHHQLKTFDDPAQDGATVTVAGYASLMDEASARETTPTLTNWRYGTLPGYGRVFDLVSIVNIRKGLARGRHLVTCTARPMEGREIKVCLYDVPVAEFPDLASRERRLATTAERVLENDATSATQCYVFTRYSDERYRLERADTPEKWHEEVGQHYSGEHIYREDCLPVPSYLRRCVDAYERIGELDNFLDNSFLGNGMTSIREYIAAQGDAAFELPA